MSDDNSCVRAQPPSPRATRTWNMFREFVDPSSQISCTFGYDRNRDRLVAKNYVAGSNPLLSMGWDFDASMTWIDERK